jgi:hypothetical protein
VPQATQNEQAPIARRPVRARWGWRLFAVVSLLYFLAAWLHPAKRAGSLGLAVVFGVIAAAQRRQSEDTPA